MSVPTWSAGARSGVWTVCPAPLGPRSVVYSFGVGDNVAWDLAMIERFGVEVHAFDPTPRCIRWVREQELPERFRFHPYGLAAADGEARFHEPLEPHRINYSVCARRSLAADTVALPVRRLGTIVRELGHEHIDVLKMDIEGAERDALADVLATELPIGQLLLEVHDGFPGIELADTVALVESLRAHGFRLFHVSERGYELAFLHPEASGIGEHR